MNKKGINNQKPSNYFGGDFDDDGENYEDDKNNDYVTKNKDSKYKANLLLNNDDEEQEVDFRGLNKKKNNETNKPFNVSNIATKRNPFESNIMKSNLPSNIMGIENSSLHNQRGTGSINPEERSFVIKYRDNIRKIFDECSERGDIEITKLKGLLEEADVNKAFSILRRKLDNLERHKKNYGGSKIRDEILKFDDFANLFEFDLKKEEDFDILFDTIDELGNNSNSIGLAELEQANKHYDLGLSSEDMEIMLKYIGKDPNVVTKDELKKAMGVTLD